MNSAQQLPRPVPDKFCILKEERGDIKQIINLIVCTKSISYLIVSALLFSENKGNIPLDVLSTTAIGTEGLGIRSFAHRSFTYLNISVKSNEQL